MFTKKAKKEEVYSSTDLSDLLSSPVFYSVIALTFILGLSSVFGFFNNPRKLKMVVDAIGQKILISPNSNTVSFDADEDFLLQKYSLKKSLKIAVMNKASDEKLNEDPYHVFSKLIVLDAEPNFKRELKKEFKRISFDYDITSKQFWGKLDASSIESAIEESQRQGSGALGGALIIGTPLSPEYSLEQGDGKYSMTAGILRL